MNSNPLNHPVDYTVWTWVVRVQSDAQTQMISKQLRAYDLIWSAQRVVRLRGNGRNHFIEQPLGFGRVRNADMYPSFFERSSWIRSFS